VKRRPLTICAVILAGFGLAGYFSSKDGNPAAPLAGIKADSVETELWSTDDGRKYALTTYSYSGPNIERSRKALEEGLKNTSYHLQFEGDDYAYFAPSNEIYVHSIGWGLKDDGEKRAIVREYWPITWVKLTYLSLSLEKGVSQLNGGRPYYIVESFPKGTPERALMTACINGDVAQANENVGHVNLKAQDFIFWALFNDHLKVAQVLLDHGANINYTYPKFPMTTVDRLATCGYPDAVQFAFDHGAHFSDDGHTALANLTRQSSPAEYVMGSTGDASWMKPIAWEKAPEIAEIYFAHGAKPNGLDPVFKQTPLASAAWTGNAKLVKELLDHGADATMSVVDLANKSKHALPYELAAENKRNQWREVIGLLQEKSATEAPRHPTDKFPAARP
jgi:hypothetical protein